MHGVDGRTCTAPAADQTRLELMARLLGESGAVPSGAAVVLVASTAEAGTGPNLLEILRT